MRRVLFGRQRQAGAGLTAAVLVFLLGIRCWGIAGTVRGDEPILTAKQTETSVIISAGTQPVATYFFADEKIFRPFYAHVFTADGIPVTRNHPPQKGEPSDHADMHPGIWLAFGDLSFRDFWRNKGRVKHLKFLEQPKETENGISFTVRNEYVVRFDGWEQRTARETCRHTWQMQDGGILLSVDSEFDPASPKELLVFGDQEEMGLGIRVATPLRVKDAGGEILSSSGQKNERDVWGKQHLWCDYRGVVQDRHVGITLMPHPDNFRPSWFHVRDYGLMVANPFGQNAFTGKEKSRIVVKPGEKLRLRFGVWIHSGKGKIAEEIENSYKKYVKTAGK